MRPKLYGVYLGKDSHYQEGLVPHRSVVIQGNLISDVIRREYLQVPHELSDGSMMSITTARWFTPNDRQINGEGLEPDIVVERTTEDVEADRDPQLDRAVEFLLNGK